MAASQNPRQCGGLGEPEVTSVTESSHSVVAWGSRGDSSRRILVSVQCGGLGEPEATSVAESSSVFSVVAWGSQG